MEQVKIKIYRDEKGKRVALPRYMTSLSAGMDLCATESVEIAVGEIVLVKTGLFVEIPDGYEIQIRPRSGLALKYGITIPNAPGTIDADYRGEIGVILMNSGKTSFKIEIGDRIAQMVVAPVVHAIWEETEQISDTERGAGGFGHTGR